MVATTWMVDRADAGHGAELGGPLPPWTMDTDQPASPARDRIPADGERQPDLLQQLAANDATAWSSMMTRYGPRLRAIGRSYRLADSEVDDVLQTTWLSLFRHSTQVRDTRCLGAWLSSTMRRACLRALSGNRHQVELVDDWDRHPARFAASREPDVSRRVELAEQVATVWNLIDGLPPRQRDLLRVLYGPDEPSYATVSGRLGIPVGAIGPIRQRALTRLRRLLAEYPAA